MTTNALAQQTYLPAPGSPLAEVHDFLAAHQDRHGSVPTPRYVLSGPGLHDQVELPGEVHAALVQVVAALRAGKAVTIAPQSTTLTTQQAADLLNVSRPTLVKLLERGEIPFERVGDRRKVLLSDVLAHRERRRAAQYAALDATSVDLDDEDDPAQVAAALREARRLAGRRTRDA